ncbi:MAG: DUF3325 domain-containing protein [Pseudomonadota bacterium]
MGIIVIGFGLCLLGCSALSVSQRRHWRALVGPEVTANRRFALVVGWLSIFTALALFIWHQGASFGILLWMLVTGAAVLATALLLAYKPQALRPIASSFRRR